MKNKFIVLSLLCSIILCSCDFNALTESSGSFFDTVEEDDYLVIDNNYYLFEDMYTLKTIIIPMINKSFTLWHWNEKKFNDKYDKYYNNIDCDADSLKYLLENNYKYCVYVGRGKAVTKDNYHISGSYYLITEAETKISTVFFVN